MCTTRIPHIVYLRRAVLLSFSHNCRNVLSDIRAVCVDIITYMKPLNLPTGSQMNKVTLSTEKPPNQHGGKAKYLEITLNDLLTWKKHMGGFIDSLHTSVCTVRRISRIAKLTYYAMFRAGVTRIPSCIQSICKQKQKRTLGSVEGNLRKQSRQTNIQTSSNNDNIICLHAAAAYADTLKGSTLFVQTIYTRQCRYFIWINCTQIL